MTKDKEIDVIELITEMKQTVKSYLKWISIIIVPLILFFIGEAFYGASKTSAIETDVKHINQNQIEIKLDIKEIKKEMSDSKDSYINNEAVQNITFDAKLNIIYEDIDNLEFYLGKKFNYKPIFRGN